MQNEEGHSRFLTAVKTYLNVSYEEAEKFIAKMMYFCERQDFENLAYEIDLKKIPYEQKRAVLKTLLLFYMGEIPAYFLVLEKCNKIIEKCVDCNLESLPRNV